MAKGDLTPKQSQFADRILQGDNQSTAYRFAYNTENMTDKQVWEEASKLAAHPKVSQRLFEGQQKARERTLVTVESITKELDESRALAIEQDNPAEMTKATMAKAKIHGLDVHKVESKDTLTITLAKDVDDI